MSAVIFAIFYRDFLLSLNIIYATGSTDYFVKHLIEIITRYPGTGSTQYGPWKWHNSQHDFKSVKADVQMVPYSSNYFSSFDYHMLSADIHNHHLFNLLKCLSKTAQKCPKFDWLQL